MIQKQKKIRAGNLIASKIRPARFWDIIACAPLVSGDLMHIPRPVSAGNDSDEIAARRKHLCDLAEAEAEARRFKAALRNRNKRVYVTPFLVFWWVRKFNPHPSTFWRVIGALPLEYIGRHAVGTKGGMREKELG